MKLSCIYRGFSEDGKNGYLAVSKEESLREFGTNQFLGFEIMIYCVKNLRWKVFLMIAISVVGNCSEYLGRKPPEVNLELIELILQNTGGGGSSGCGRFSLTPIRGGPDQANIPTNGTRQGFNVRECRSDAQIQGLGFIPSNLVYEGVGVKGNSTSSRMGSQTDFVTLGGRKDQVIEVTFTLDRADASLEVIGNASVSSNGAASGPGFRITTETISAFGTSGGNSGFQQGAPPTTPQGTEVTYCLEIHDEGSAHLFGWSKPCANLTVADRQNYEFDLTGLPSQLPGNRVGFVLNGATIFQFAIGERIGLSGSILWTERMSGR